MSASGPNPASSSPAPAPAPSPAPAAQLLRSQDLLRGRRIVEIAHNGEVYRLQETRLGKLILTK